jgi:transglutaminase-like putative cysteine protease
MSALALGAIRLLPWAQPLVESATAGFASPSLDSGYSGFSLDSRLGSIQELSLSERVVLRVWTDEPRYLRARVATRFDGRAWHASQAKGSRRTLAPDAAGRIPELSAWATTIPGRNFLLRDPPRAAPITPTRIIQAVTTGSCLPAPAHTFFARAPFEQLETDPAGVLFSTGEETPGVYGVAAARALPESQPSEPPDNMAACLELPQPVDARLLGLAKDLAAGARAQREILDRTVLHLRSRCRYSLRVGRFTSNDPVAEFLFDKRVGYCEYFASAAVLLLRLQGVPARYVTGFHLSPFNEEAGHYVVRDKDAHAWIEAHIQGEGWIEADPTPPGDYEDAHRRQATGWQEAWERLRGGTAWVAAVVRQALREGDFAWLARRALGEIAAPANAHPFLTGLAALALLSFATRRYWRRLIRARRPARVAQARAGVPQDLAEAVTRLETAWSALGLARPSSRPLLEHARGLPDARLPPALRSLGIEIVRAFYRAAFGHERVPTDDVADLQRRLRTVRRRR